MALISRSLSTNQREAKTSVSAEDSRIFGGRLGFDAAVLCVVEVVEVPVGKAMASLGNWGALVRERPVILRFATES